MNNPIDECRLVAEQDIPYTSTNVDSAAPSLFGKYLKATASQS